MRSYTPFRYRVLNCILLSCVANYNKYICVYENVKWKAGLPKCCAGVTLWGSSIVCSCENSASAWVLVIGACFLPLMAICVSMEASLWMRTAACTVSISRALWNLAVRWTRSVIPTPSRKMSLAQIPLEASPASAHQVKGCLHAGLWEDTQHCTVLGDIQVRGRGLWFRALCQHPIPEMHGDCKTSRLPGKCLSNREEGHTGLGRAMATKP